MLCANHNKWTLEIDPSKIDINVHPTKTEIKFEDERVIYAVMRAAVKKALGTHSVTPSIDFDQDINFGVITSGRRDYGNEEAPFKMPPITPREQNNQQNWNKLYDGFDRGKSTQTIPSKATTEQYSFQSKMNAAEDISLSEDTTARNETSGNSSFQIQDKYLVTQVKSGLMLVNHCAAQERILFEKYRTIQQRKTSASQQFLFPQTIELSPSDFALVNGLEEEIRVLGFMFEPFGGNTIVVNGIPADVPAGKEKELFEGFLEQFKHNRDSLHIELKESMVRALAKRSVQKTKRFSQLETSSLIDRLFACETPNYTPEGEPTFVILNGDTLESYFKKQ